MLKSRSFSPWHITAMFLLCLIFLTACQDSLDNNNLVNNFPSNKPDNPSGSTFIEFKNLEEFPVKIYGDPARQVVFAEIPATGTRRVSAEPAPMGRAFYPTFILIYPVGNTGNVNIPYNAPSITAAVLADRINTVSIPKLENIVINSAYIMLENNSSFSLTFNEGPLEKNPIGGGSTLINSNQNASYEITPKSVSSYSVLRNGSIPVVFPNDLTEFKAGIIYVLTYNGTVLTLASQNSILQNIPPSTPTNVRVEEISTNRVQIAWDAVYGATSYRVYRTRGSATASYSQMANITTLSWTDTSTSTGYIYYYKVSAVSGINMVSEQSAAVFAIMPPSNVRRTSVTNTKIDLGWDALSGASGYNIYRSTSENEAYTKINSTAVSGTTFTDTGLSSSTEYYYKVSAIVNGIEGLQSSPVFGSTSSSVPTNLHITEETNTNVNLAWNSVNGASGYNVYRSNSENGTYTKINSTAINVTSFSDTGFTAYTTYYYKVSAIVGGFESGMSSYVSASTGIIVPGSGLTAKLTWLQNNVVSNKYYLIEITTDENIVPQSLSYGYKNGITITMRSNGSMRNINLSAQGCLFTIGSSVTLILDNNITLNGRSGNNDSLVCINGGTLEINTGTKITGNSYSGSGGKGGGVYNYGGYFIMNGGEISGNNAYYGGGVYNYDGVFSMNDGKISSNTSSNGGGVYVTSGTFSIIGGEISSNIASINGGGVFVRSRFYMDGGKISGNNATGSNSDGGGVYVNTEYADVNNFNMKSGEISGNTATRNGGGVYLFGTFLTGGGVIFGSNAATGLKNTASAGASLYKSSGTAQYGTVNENNFYRSGDLTTTNTTIRIVNGDLLTE